MAVNAPKQLRAPQQRVVAERIVEVCSKITGSVNDKIHNSVKLNRRSETAELTAYAGEIETILSESVGVAKLNPAKRELRKLAKTISGLIDGLDDVEMTASEYRAMLDTNLLDYVALASSQASDFMLKLSESEDLSSDPFQNVGQISSKDGSMSSNAVLQRLRDAYTEMAEANEAKSAAEYAGEDDDLPDDSVPDHKLTRTQMIRRNDAKSKKRLSGYAKYRSKLPNSVPLFTILENMPIVPVFKDRMLMTEANLKSAGIKHTVLVKSSRLGEPDTFVLDGQYLLAFNRTAITRGKPTPKSKKSQDRLSKEYEDLVADVLNQINERSTIKYTIVSKFYRVNERNRNIMFVWLMPTAKLARLRQAANEKHGLTMESWGFPWSVKVEE